MVDINPESLPYPPAKVVVSRGKWVQLDHEIIDGASGQCLNLPLRDSAGVLFFRHDGVGFYPDSGEVHEWPFETIEAHRVKRFWLRPASIGVLHLVAGGESFRFRIGRMLAANADHILRAVQAEAESQEQ